MTTITPPTGPSTIISIPQRAHTRDDRLSPKTLTRVQNDPLHRGRTMSNHEMHHYRTHSPPNTHHPIASPLPDNQPRFAEELTPLKFRRRRQKQNDTPGPQQAGPSRYGYFTDTGDLYRGAMVDPTNVPVIDEDAITLGGSSSASSGSTWSWGSGNLERGRRATMAALGRLIRRGSSGSDSDDSSEHELRSTISRAIRTRRLSRTISTVSKGSSSPERPKRQHLPKRREFTLLLPLNTIKSTDSQAGPVPFPGITAKDHAVHRYPQERLITTPSLPIVLDQIRALRSAAGMTSAGPPVADVPVRRGGSAPGRPRDGGRPRPKFRGPTPSFLNPPVPRPGQSRTQSRLHTLQRQNSDHLIRPKSVADLLGIPNPKGSTTSLTALNEDPETLAVKSKGKEKAKGCWWLDVACPGWEDLRDIGEVRQWV